MHVKAIDKQWKAIRYQCIFRCKRCQENGNGQKCESEKSIPLSKLNKCIMMIINDSVRGIQKRDVCWHGRWTDSIVFTNKKGNGIH